ncbi:hypothetical protein [Ralstonia phage phiITL-1]|uniref:Uncharacterized protein n=1 Tax=Ralstonia phage phiITL-1 TaxID=1597967 RepID=A0A0U1ZHK7_9CAUD|nr:hypothetical protein HOR02_gp54 [Ralstonia phage phiITL-1]AJT60838.1 hypothetical protein [Ralstonia phage phiITL-1]
MCWCARPTAPSRSASRSGSCARLATPTPARSRASSAGGLATCSSSATGWACCRARTSSCPHRASSFRSGPSPWWLWRTPTPSTWRSRIAGSRSCTMRSRSRRSCCCGQTRPSSSCGLTASCPRRP